MKADFFSQPISVFITAGEASGDVLGAQLMRALREKTGGQVRFSGVGGPQMEAEGLCSLFPMQDLSVMGVAEVLPNLKKILRRIRQTAAAIDTQKPDVVVTIDSPDFSFRVARRLRSRPPAMIHYVAPTVWAWRPGRAKKIAALYDGIICLLPFEPPYFEREGMKAVFAGHPMLAQKVERAEGMALRGALGIAREQKVLGVLFGSRSGELKRTAPVLRDAALNLAAAHKNVVILAPTLPYLKTQVEELLSGLSCRAHVLTDPAQKWPSFAAMDAAMATSGTVGLELAVAGVPHAIAYRMNDLTWKLLRPHVSAKYAHLANILMDREMVPEFVQKDCRSDDIAKAVEPFLLSAGNQSSAFDGVRETLHGNADAAAFVLRQAGRA